MQSKKNLTLQIAGAAALAMLVGTSAFAESRHHEGTSRPSSSGSSTRAERSSGSRSNGGWNRSESRAVAPSQSQRSWGNEQRSYNRGNEQRTYGNNGNVQRETISRESGVQRPDGNWRGSESRGNNGNWRGGNTSRGPVVGRETARGTVGNRGGAVVLPRGVERDRFHYVPGFRGGVAPYRAHEAVTSYGRVERYERWHGGYRVWIGGGLYPIFVPFERWSLFPLRAGLYIRFGGYWDPLGYWSIYDYSPYYGYYDNAPYYGSAVTSGIVHGVVESIDYRRGTMVINDDVSRQFVTVMMPRDRRMNDIHSGDYVEFSGDWDRGGVFDAYRLERWDYGRDGYRNDRNYDPNYDGNGY